MKRFQYHFLVVLGFLGHKSLKTTQHYAKILDKKVSDDMQALKNKFKLKEEKNNTVVKLYLFYYS